MECHSDLILNSLATYSFPLDWLPAPPPHAIPSSSWVLSASQTFRTQQQAARTSALSTHTVLTR